MKPLIALIVIFLSTLATQKIVKGIIKYRLAGRIAMASMLVFTAVGHFVFSDGMTAMIPAIIPFKIPIVYGTGVLELMFAMGLLIPSWERRTGQFIILFFLCILPANINAALHELNYQTGDFDGPGPAYLWFRVPLQIVFIVWVYLAAVREPSKT